MSSLMNAIGTGRWVVVTSTGKARQVTISHTKAFYVVVIPPADGDHQQEMVVVGCRN